MIAPSFGVLIAGSGSYFGAANARAPDAACIPIVSRLGALALPETHGLSIAGPFPNASGAMRAGAEIGPGWATSLTGVAVRTGDGATGGRFTSAGGADVFSRSGVKDDPVHDPDCASGLGFCGAATARHAGDDCSTGRGGDGAGALHEPADCTSGLGAGAFHEAEDCDKGLGAGAARGGELGNGSAADAMPGPSVRVP